MLKTIKKTFLLFMMVTIFFLVGCENEEEKAAFLGSSNNNSAVNTDEDLNVLSSIKTDLLRNGRDLLDSEHESTHIFCPTYDLLGTTERLDFWSKLIYKVAKSETTEVLGLLGCGGASLTSLDRALCVADSLQTSLVKRRMSMLLLLSEELLIQTKAFEVCRLQ